MLTTSSGKVGQGRSVIRHFDSYMAMPISAIAVHIVLGPLLAISTLVSTAHAWTALLVGLWIAVTSRRIDRVAFAAGYLATCDVLWRVTNARFFYEGGKYAVVAVLVIGYLRLVRTRRRFAFPAAYFLLLLPSLAYTVAHYGLLGSRDQVSFNLSGPLALAVTAFFFLQVRMRWDDMRGILLASLCPLVALVSTVTYRTSQVTNLTFGTESNNATSGGWGPNQVSTVLCLGALLCLILVVLEPRMRTRITLVGLGLWLFGQGALTFSRGGVYDLAVAAAVLLLIVIVQSRHRARVLVGLLVMLALASLVFGHLDTYTGGALSERFSETDTTGRSDIAEGDLRLFEAHPVAGVGAGMAPQERTGFLRGAPAHTEFTRTIAEHGALGIIALLAVVLLVGQAFLSSPSVWGRAVTTSLAVFALFAMSNTAMRTATVPFVLGLGMARVGARVSRGVSNPGQGGQTSTFARV